MFYTALTKAAQLISRSPQLHGHLKKAWDTLPQLLEEVERSDLNETQRLGRKAELFKVIKNPEASMALLNEIRQMQPAEGQNPKHLKLTIENLVEMKEFEQAVAMIELVKCTSQDTEVFRSFDDEQYVLKVYAQAAKQALLTDSPTEHFRAAFIDTMMQTQFEGSSTSDTDSSDGDPETWDIMMIYNRKKDSCAQTAKAKAVARILTDACGLKVTVMDDAVRLGRLADDGMVHVMRRSHMVLVLAGSQRICSEMRMLVSHATRRPESNTVTLLTDGEHVPLKLKTYRSMPCPPELLLPVTERVERSREQTGRYSEQTIRAICKLFGFLVGIHKGNG
nr:hypothetical protein BaRGS_031602 [Batillaria attramentaria]